MLNSPTPTQSSTRPRLRSQATHHSPSRRLPNTGLLAGTAQKTPCRQIYPKYRRDAAEAPSFRILINLPGSAPARTVKNITNENRQTAAVAIQAFSRAGSRHVPTLHLTAPAVARRWSPPANPPRPDGRGFGADRTVSLPSTGSSGDGSSPVTRVALRPSA